MLRMLTESKECTTAMTDRQVLILFTRYPVPGNAKTRLIPVLGALAAARLQRCMTESVANYALRLADTLGVMPVVSFDGGSVKQMTDWLGPAFTYCRQSPGDLGRRMTEAFAATCTKEVAKTVLAGSDIPGLTDSLLVEAFQALDSSEVVLGPAADGGYYLIGMKRPVRKRLLPHIFAGISWSTATVLAETIGILDSLQVSYATLPTLRDIDRPEDLDLAGVVESF